jgi:apolipoprotein N-acyltransferase
MNLRFRNGRTVAVAGCPLQFLNSKKDKVMKKFLRSTLVVAVLALGANGLMAAQASSNAPALKQLVKETKAREVTAETPNQHKALAAEYRQLAQRQLAESNEHAEQAAWYARFPIYSSAKFRPATIDHCLYFAGKYRSDAQRSEKMAARHEALAI